jgi:periplasmic divalent cation tolerance protein
VPAKEPDDIVVLVTTRDEQEAHEIARLLLNERKAACVNILARVDSVFWWQGHIDSAQESLMIIKSKAALLPEIVNVVKVVHSYQVPEIVAIPIIGGNEDYLEWMNSEVDG